MRFLINTILATIFLTLSLSVNVNAQLDRKFTGYENLPEFDYRPYNFGFSLGFNWMFFSLKPVESIYQLNDSIAELPQGFGTFGPLTSVLPKPDWGFNIGIVSNLRINSMLDLRFIPTLVFGGRFVEYTYRFGEDNSQTGVVNYELETTNIDFPVHFKFKSVRIHSNLRVYLLGGLKYSLDLSSNQNKAEGEDGNILYLRTAKHDLMYELGAGFDVYFNWFKFSAEVKASFGLGNLALPGDSNPMFYSSIDRLNSRSIMISFLFE